MSINATGLGVGIGAPNPNPGVKLEVAGDNVRGISVHTKGKPAILAFTQGLATEFAGLYLQSDGHGPFIRGEVLTPLSGRLNLKLLTTAM
jgi:hypothetical protein